MLPERTGIKFRTGSWLPPCQFVFWNYRSEKFFAWPSQEFLLLAEPRFSSTVFVEVQRPTKSICPIMMTIKHLSHRINMNNNHRINRIKRIQSKRLIICPRKKVSEGWSVIFKWWWRPSKSSWSILVILWGKIPISLLDWILYQISNA